ncbi:MAG TPA: M20/M25/M40 family metallo-hydrolase [Candidatus Methanoperedens sp.]|nr:M20/M25/M40 family metallo-hydrolase [Candidatus Methanoperedens sp.]
METKLIKKLIEIKSLSSDPKECLKALKIIKEEIEDNKIPVSIKSNKGQPFLIAGNLDKASILFLSHMDVVPAKNDGFELKIKNNKLFGRGVLDMKGPLVASLNAFIKLWKDDNKNIIFAVTTDEEIGGFKGAAFLVENAFKNIKIAIIPDSSSEDLVLIQKAPFHIKVIAKGKSAHGSKPWEGINAAENLLRCCKKIINNFKSSSHEESTATLSQFHSGEATNMLPDKAEAVIDIRIKQESEVKTIIKILDNSTKKFGCEWKKIDKPLFFEVEKNNFFIKKWQQAYKAVHKKQVKFIVENGASDARFLWKELRIPVIVTSIKGGGAHSKNEWADINSLNKLTETIVKFIISL